MNKKQRLQILLEALRQLDNVMSELSLDFLDNDRFFQVWNGIVELCELVERETQEEMVEK